MLRDEKSKKISFQVSADNGDIVLKAENGKIILDADSIESMPLVKAKRKVILISEHQIISNLSLRT